MKELHIQDSEGTIGFGNNTSHYNDFGNPYYLAAFYDCPLENIYLGRNISWSPFENNTSLKSVVIGNNVTTIGEHLFSGCTGLTEITIPDNVTSIESFAFSGCSGLTNIRLSNNIASIAYATFEGCKSLTSIVIPENVTSIDYRAFNDCSGLEKIYLMCATPPTVAEKNYTNAHFLNTTVYVPQGSLETYQSSDVWGNFWNIKYLVKTQPTAENLQIELDCSEEGIEYQWYESVGEYTYTKEIIPTSNGDYAWTDSAGIWTSGNWGKYQTKSIMNATIDFQIGDTISFDYTVPKGDGYSYSGSQWFSFLFNGKTVMQTFGRSGNSSHYELGINEYIYTNWMKGDSTVTIGFECVRNGDGNSEHATVSDIKLIRPTGFPMGEWVDEKIAGATTAMLDENMFVKGGVAYCVVNFPNGITLMSDKVRVPSYTLTYMIDGEVYYKDTLRYKAKIVQPEVPIKEGYTFSGWSEAPTIMPANDIIVEGSYIADTAIEHVLLYPEKNEVYNAQGVRITDTSNLVRGIYIINGKRIFVK